MTEEEFTPMEDDPEYQEWLAELSKDCVCCSCCQDVPCGGLMVGGWCDEMRCNNEEDIW